MIIKAISENTSISDDYGKEHGLSLYIEALGHKILFDTGASELFAQNARKMGVDLSAVDLAVISHGHNDHGNGVKTFLEINPKAPVYIHKNAFAAHSARALLVHVNIGLDKKLQQSPQLVLTDENTPAIASGLELFSAVKGDRLMPPSNKRLFAKKAGKWMNDDFKHEQHLVITDENNTVLISGCAHRGIVNILETFKAEKGFYPSHVIGGLHLKDADREFLNSMAEYLTETKIKFYTCHCTGLKSYKLLKEIMNEQIDYISGGSTLEIS